MSETGPSVKSGIARIAGVVAVAGALGLGLDQKKAYADDPPKTPTPVGTPAPDYRSTATALEQERKALEEQERKKQEEKAVIATITAEREKINALRGTPTATSTPSPTRIPDATTVAESTRIANLAKFQAQIIATATAEAEATAKAKATATPIPPTATPGPGEQGGRDPTPQPPTPPPPAQTGKGSESGGFDVLKFAKDAKDNAGLLVGAGGAAALAILGAAKLRRRRGPGGPPSPDADIPPLPANRRSNL